jgi:hypothetical protein
MGRIHPPPVSPNPNPNPNPHQTFFYSYEKMLRALGHVGRGARVFTSRLPSTRPPAHASSGRVSVTPTRAYSRMYPDAPRVGVGVVVLRHNPSTRVPEILLIKRGTVRRGPPSTT